MMMTPVIHRWRKYRFLCHSREEDRPHVHIMGPDGKAKIWLSPQVAIAYNRGIDVAPEVLRHGFEVLPSGVWWDALDEGIEFEALRHPERYPLLMWAPERRKAK